MAAMETVFGVCRAESDTRPGAPDILLDARRDDASGGWTFRVFDQPIYTVHRDDQLVPATESLLTHLFCRLQPSLFVLHTGMVEWNGRGILIPGERGSGKSTLTLWLARQGARYFGDDLILVDFDRQELLAVPKAVTLKAGSFDCFEETQTYHDPIRGPVRYFRPDSAGLHRMPLNEVKLVVFPQFEYAGARPPYPLSSGWTALALVQQLFGGFAWDDRALPLIARLAEIPALVLPYRNLAEAQQAIQQALEAQETPDAALS